MSVRLKIDGKKMSTCSVEIPEIESIDELEGLYSIEQIWIDNLGFYISTKSGEVFIQHVDGADYPMGVEKVMGEYHDIIFDEFRMIKDKMKIRDRSDLERRLERSLWDLKSKGILILPNQRMPQDLGNFSRLAREANDKEKEIVRRVNEDCLKGYLYISRQDEEFHVCYGSNEEKLTYWPGPNFTIREIANDITLSFQENSVPHIFRGNISSPIIIPLKTLEEIK